MPKLKNLSYFSIILAVLILLNSSLVITASILKALGINSIGLSISTRLGVITIPTLTGFMPWILSFASLILSITAIIMGLYDKDRQSFYFGMSAVTLSTFSLFMSPLPGLI